MCPGFPAILAAVIIPLFLSFTDGGPDEGTISDQNRAPSSCVTLFFSGDVMTGRGIDQILPNPVDPRLYESYVKDASVYVRLAERATGRIDKPVSYSYIWGDAIDVWEEMEPAARIINLETSITSHDVPWPGKGINYRMHPGNVEVLTSAGIDFCSLANNHTMDWGQEGLLETLRTLENASIGYAGAGVDLSEAGKPAIIETGQSRVNEAGKPAIIETGQSRVIVFAFGSVTAGVPLSWAAGSGNRAAGAGSREDGAVSRAKGSEGWADDLGNREAGSGSQAADQERQAAVSGSWADGSGSLAAGSGSRAADSGSREAGLGSAGLNVLPGMHDEAVSLISRQVDAVKQPGDIVVFSIHWGSNWGYDIPASHREFARKLIDNAGVDVVHGHSSHHPMGIEVYRDRLIIYGAGDFINDYEGISGREEYRGELTLMYFPCIDPSDGSLVSMTMVPMQIRNFRIFKNQKNE